MFIRLPLLVLVGVLALAACSTTPSAPLLTDAERCARFGGSWRFDTCRAGGL